MVRAENPVSLNAHQFVGYWGSDQAINLQRWLKQISTLSGTDRAAQKQWFQWVLGDKHWGIVYQTQDEVGTGDIVSAERAIVPLSVSGIEPEAWVKLEKYSLVLGREPFGRVPLYWTQCRQTIWFASQLSLLLPILDQYSINMPAVYGYSCFSYVPTPLTPISNVFSIPAGGELRWTIEDGELQKSTWTRSLEWQEATDQIHDEALAIEQLQTALKDAVYEQVANLSDEPVGVFLSGGLDSSIVAALLVQAGIKVRAYTLDFGNEESSELPFAEMVADFLQIPLMKVDASPRKIRQAIVPTAQALDLPFGDGVTVPLFLLGQAASQEVKVIFNGEGGDQLFAGWTNKPLIAAGIYQSEYPTQDAFIHQYLRTFHRLWGYESQIFAPAIATQIHALSPQVWIMDALNSDYSNSLLHRLRRATLMLKGAQNIQPRASALGMAHGLRVRSPFCNIPLAQLAFQISGALHLQGSCEKYILKRTVESWLPPEVVWRTKRGMGVPLTAWLLQELWRENGRWLNPFRLRQEGIWQPDLAIRIASGELGTIQGRRIGESLWLLLMWQAWRTAVLQEANSSPSFDHPFWLPAWLGRQFLHLRRSLHQW